ncbi:MAG: ADP-ribosylglycohydrolase family protein [Planctomycetota bacterium]
MTNQNNQSDVECARERALLSLIGLSIGDGFGYSMMWEYERVAARQEPTPPWTWTDDTEMACSVVATLLARGRIDADHLAASFAEHHDPGRMYGPRMLHEYFPRVFRGEPWSDVAASLFGGSGSFGNGAAMRIAPLGAYFAGDPERAAAEAEVSARVTHTHPEGVAGAVAVAIAASLFAAHDVADHADFLQHIAGFLSATEVRYGLERAASIPDDTTPEDAAAELGNGSRVSAQDTVPFSIWSASTGRTNFASAIWRTVSVGGDMDTTAAMVGGMLAPFLGEPGIPPAWLAAREPLPTWVTPAR